MAEPPPADFEEQQAFAAGSLRAARRARLQAALEEALAGIVRAGGRCFWRAGRGTWLLEWWLTECPPVLAHHQSRHGCFSGTLTPPFPPIPHPYSSAVNDKRDHIPPVVSASAVTFPFDIQVAGWAPGARSRASVALQQPRRLFLSLSLLAAI